MYILVILSLTPVGLALLLTPFVRNIFRRRGWLDRQDARKLHPTAVPRVGGIAIAVAYAASLTLTIFIPSPTSSLAWQCLPIALRFLPAVALIFLVGLADDLFNLGASLKLIGQIVASAIAIWAGVQIHGVAGVNFPAWIGIPTTVLWLVGCSNAFNLIDGVDGLAAGAGLFATITTLTAALLQHNTELVLATIPLAGAIFGFLRYNFNPASIFLGDCGSLFLGFLLGSFGVMWSQKSATALGMTAPLVALAIPLLDTLISMVRRFIRSQPVFTADREHIHHKLLQKGLSPKRVALLMYGACGLSAVLSLLLSANHSRSAGLIIVIFCVAVWIGIQHLGYAEFQLARRLVIAGTYRRLLNSHLILQAFQRELGAASGIDQIWAVIQRSYRIFGFHEVELQFDDQKFSDSSVDGGHRSWTARIPLSHFDWLTLTRRTDSDHPPIVAVYIEMLSSVLREKLPELRATGYKAAEYAHIQIASAVKAKRAVAVLGSD